MASSVKLDIKLESDWKATDAWISGGPIVLVKIESTSGDVRKSRFDLQKAVFIDEAPAGPKGKLELAQSLAALTHSE